MSKTLEQRVEQLEKRVAELEKVVRPKGSKRLGGSEKAFIKASEAVKAEAYCEEKQVSANTMRESSVNLDETMASMANLARKELSRLLE